MMACTEHVCAVLLLCSMAISAHQGGPLSNSSTDGNSGKSSSANVVDTALHSNTTTTTQPVGPPEEGDIRAASLTEADNEFAQEGFLVVKRLRKKRRKHKAPLENSTRPESDGEVSGAKLPFVSEEGGKNKSASHDEELVVPRERNEGVSRMAQEEVVKSASTDSEPEKSPEGFIDLESLPADYTFSESVLAALDFPDSDTSGLVTRREQQAVPKELTASSADLQKHNKTPAESNHPVDPDSLHLSYTPPEAFLHSGDHASRNEEKRVTLSPAPSSKPSASLPSSSASSSQANANDSVHQHHIQSSTPVPTNFTEGPQETTARAPEKQQVPASQTASDKDFDDRLEVLEDIEEYYDDSSDVQPEALHRYKRAVTTTTFSGGSSIGFAVPETGDR